MGEEEDLRALEPLALRADVAVLDRDGRARLDALCGKDGCDGAEVPAQAHLGDGGAGQPLGQQRRHLQQAKRRAGVPNPEVTNILFYWFFGLYFLPKDLNEVWNPHGQLPG